MRRKRTHPPVLNACAVHLHLQAGGTRREPATASSTVFPLAPHKSFAYATFCRVLVQYVPRDSIHILCHYTTLAYTPRNPLYYTVSYVGAPPPLILVYPYEYLMQGATSVHRGALMYSLPISANFTMYVLHVV